MKYGLSMKKIKELIESNNMGEWTKITNYTIPDNYNEILMIGYETKKSVYVGQQILTKYAINKMPATSNVTIGDASENYINAHVDKTTNRLSMNNCKINGDTSLTWAYVDFYYR